MFLVGALLVVALAALAGALYQMVSMRRDVRRYPAPGALIDISQGVAGPHRRDIRQDVAGPHPRDRGGQRLHARCAGDGRPPVIFEAGIAASSVSWSLVQPEVARLTRTCSYDRAGLAWSDPTRARPTLAGLVDQLARLGRALSLEPPYVLVGHSFGTFVVRAYAASRPQEVAGLVLVDPITTDEWLEMTAEQRRLLQGGVLLSRVGALLARFGVVRASLALLAGGARIVPRGVAGVFGPTTLRVLERLIGEVQKLPPDVLPAVQALWCRPQSFRGMAAYLAALPACAASLAAAPAPGALGNIPLVVLSAANSKPDRLREHEALARQSSRGVHRIASRGGHWINLDDPALVVDAVRELIDVARRERA